MPRVSRWMVRSSLAFLVAGATIGTALLAEKALGVAPGLYLLLPAHREMLLVGWLLQLAMGVGFWILPALKAAQVRERPGIVAWALLNGGVLLVTWSSVADGAAWGSALGRGAEAAATLVFGAAFLRGRRR